MYFFQRRNKEEKERGKGDCNFNCVKLWGMGGGGPKNNHSKNIVSYRDLRLTLVNLLMWVTEGCTVLLILLNPTLLKIKEHSEGRGCKVI
jgi:hypothetical protein